MATTERTTVVGVFHDRGDAERAIDELKRNGFRDEQIGIAARDAEHKEGTIRSSEDEGDAGSGAATGALTGGVLGGVLGALAAGLIPGVGPVLAGGLLAGVLGGAAVGAAAGGLLGALTNMGVPEEDARYYDEEFKGGRTIVTVKSDGRFDDARSILYRHNAYDVDTRDSERARMPHMRSTETESVAPARRSFVDTDRSGTDTMELREEELTARKERTEAGKVEVEKDVVTQHRSMDVPVTREEVTIDRHPVDRRPSDSPISDKDQIEVEVTREDVIPEKRSVVYEEVELQKRAVQDTERVEADVRREVADVNRSGDARVSGDTTSFNSWDEAMPSYRQRWQTRLGSSGGRWEDAEPGYHYGYEMSRDPRYQGREWQDIEPQFRSDYSEWSRQRGYGSGSSTWDSVREHARESWDEARQKARGR